MVLTYEKVFGHKKGEGPSGPFPFQKDVSDNPDAVSPDIPKGGEMNDKKYVVVCDVLVEKGARHLRGEALKVNIDDERAAVLIRAGYIDEVKPEAPEAKAPDAPPVDKMIDKAPEKKGATGKGADLLKNKKGKK